MKKLRIPFRVHSTGWLLVALCISFGVMLDGPRLGLVFGLVMVASLLLHEGGHILAAVLLGVPVREFGLRIAGAYIRRARAATLQDEVLIAALLRSRPRPSSGLRQPRPRPRQSPAAPRQRRHAHPPRVTHLQRSPLGLELRRLSWRRSPKLSCKSPAR